MRSEETPPHPEVAIRNHDPARYEGRLWDELSISEQEAAIIADCQMAEIPEPAEVAV